jgi:hypothetical protein
MKTHHTSIITEKSSVHMLAAKTLVQLDIMVHSGLREVDTLLGGFKAREITLLDGNSTLISELQNQLCVNTYKTFHSDTLYIDGGMCANPYNIARYARMMELDQRQVLDHIQVSRAFTVYQLSTLIQDLLEPLVKKHSPRTLLIGMFPALYLDPDVPSNEAQTLLKTNLEKLRQLTHTYHLITVFTNLDATHLSSHRNLRRTLYTAVNEIVRMKELAQCTYVDLVKRKQGTTIVSCGAGQLRLEDFGMVM